jgi:hypothetical protein
MLIYYSTIQDNTLDYNELLENYIEYYNLYKLQILYYQSIYKIDEPVDIGFFEGKYFLQAHKGDLK